MPHSNLRFRILSFLFFLITCSWVQADAGEVFEIQLSWKAVPGADHYRIQIGTGPGFETIEGESESSEASWTWHYQPKEGGVGNRFYYRIASVNEKGEVGAYSAAQSLFLPELKNQKEVRSYLRFGGTLDAGWGGFKQNSGETNLRSVVSDSMTFQQRVSLQVDLYQSSRLTSPGGTLLEEHPFRPRWTLSLKFRYASYSQEKNPRPFDQPNVSAYGLSLDILHWLWSDSNWHWGYGLLLNRSFRWNKTGPESVDAQGGYSAGPASCLVWRASNPKVFVPAEAAILLETPISGLLTGGQAGIDFGVWSEWSIFRIHGTQFGVRLEGDYDYLQWPTPLQTSILTWTLWGALAYHVGPNVK